jgi:crossover junction endodeoxyribonuclease RuvC
MAVELLYFATNVTTAISVGQARGVVLLAASEHGLELGEYTPLQVKQAVTGYGKADKKQIQEMVKMMLGLDGVPKPDDAADGLAIAITHAHQLVGAKT